MEQDFTGWQVNQYIIYSAIGHGAAARVYRAIDISFDDSPALAIKCERADSNTIRRYQQLMEITNHKKVSGCGHILKLYDHFQEIVGRQLYFFLVFPLCKTDMFKVIWKDKAKVYLGNDALIKEAFVDLLDGVQACHQRGIFHRDLKPENILCNSDGRGIRVSDFGLSCENRVCSDGGCGTSPYMCPESLEESEPCYYGDAADVWSLGVILFNMVTGCYPWVEARIPQDREYMAFLSKPGDHFLKRAPISKSLNTLLCWIWHPRPHVRLSVREIRKAILKMHTFYEPRPNVGAIRASAASMEAIMGVVDSQQTCVEAREDKPRKRVDCDKVDAAMAKLRL